MKDRDDKRQFTIAGITGKDEVVERLTELKSKFESGEVRCAALRIYKADGTCDDVVLGGDSDVERDQALDALRAALRAAAH